MLIYFLSFFNRLVFSKCIVIVGLTALLAAKLSIAVAMPGPSAGLIPPKPYSHIQILGHIAIDPFGYDGEQTDLEVDDQNLRAREYDTHAARFLQQDFDEPYVEQLNLYVAFRSDPINRADPQGHFSGKQLGAGALGAVAPVLLGTLTPGGKGIAMFGGLATGALAGYIAHGMDSGEWTGENAGYAALVGAGTSLLSMYGSRWLSKNTLTRFTNFAGNALLSAGMNLGTQGVTTLYDNETSLSSEAISGAMVSGAISAAVAQIFIPGELPENSLAELQKYGKVIGSGQFGTAYRYPAVAPKYAYKVHHDSLLDTDLYDYDRANNLFISKAGFVDEARLRFNAPKGEAHYWNRINKTDIGEAKTFTFDQDTLKQKTVLRMPFISGRNATFQESLDANQQLNSNYHLNMYDAAMMGNFKYSSKHKRVVAIDMGWVFPT